MATSLEAPSSLLSDPKEDATASSPLLSPASDKRFWSTLHTRVDALLRSRQSHAPPNEQRNRLKEDSALLIRGFDSVAHTLSLLSNNLDNALQGARELSKPPTLTDIYRSKFDKAENKDGSGEQEKEESKQGVKRKFHNNDSSEDTNALASEKENMQDRNLKKARNLAVSMATKAASIKRELKSLKSDLSFMQERCGLLEEENRRLRDGFEKGVRPEEDDLVRLQLEALLAEKSRLASENANLMRENQCLHQLVEYHQLASQDLSDSYENVIQGTCLDFSSPIAEETWDEEDVDDENRESHTPRNVDDHGYNLSASLDNEETEKSF